MMPRRLVVIPDAARRPAYRPPSFRPPALRLGAPELGQAGLSVNWSNIGQTIMLGAFGAGAMYAAPLLPDPMKTIAMVGGVGLIGYAAYTLLGQSPKADSEVPAGTSSPIPSTRDFEAIAGQILQPKAGSSGGFNWFSDTYQVKALVSNPNPRPVTLTLELLANEYPKLFYFIPLGSYENYIADTKTVQIPPGNITVDFNPAIKMSRWLGGGGKLNMELTLRKIRVAGESTPLDQVSFTLVG
jgi:hypothetical protein